MLDECEHAVYEVRRLTRRAATGGGGAASRLARCGPSLVALARRWTTTFAAAAVSDDEPVPMGSFAMSCANV